MTRARLIFALFAAAGAAGAALVFDKPHTTPPAGQVLSASRRPAMAAVPSPWRTATDTVRRGERLAAVLQRTGLSSEDAGRVLRSAASIDPRRIRAGTTVVAKVHPDSGVAEVVLQLAIDRLVRLTRAGGTWAEREETLAWTTDTVVVAGAVQSTLVAALASGGDAFPAAQRTEVAYALADILEYKVDLSRDLHVGDSVRVLVERERAPNGLVRAGNVLAARLTMDGRRVETVRFESAGSKGRVSYFDGEGKTMRAAFLRAPLAFRRISSVFGLRKHPILGIWRRHAGTDYSAAQGTPVRALGDGTVIFAGWKGGYGRVLEIRHRNGYVTRYGHLSGFANGIRVGAPVSISRTVAYVGATGLATAPHLHFEVLVNGSQRDPRTALKGVTGDPLAIGQRAAFSARKTQLFALLDAGASNTGHRRAD